MTRSRLRLASLVVVLGLSACQGLKDALTAHVDVVARAGSHELSVDRLAALLGPSQIPLTSSNVRGIAGLWVNYQLLGHAAAIGDTLATPENATAGMWFQLEQRRVNRFFGEVSKGWAAPDPASFEQAYKDGKLLAAAHILLSKQPEGMPGTNNDSVRKEAERIAATVTTRTFAAVAKARSSDPGSKDNGGDYGVFAPGAMVPEFDAGILSVPPGGITKVVETQFGYHIIRRHTWDEIKDKFVEQYQTATAAQAESTFFDGLVKNANVQVKPAAPKIVKSIATDPDSHRDDRTVVVSTRSGGMTASRLAQWIAGIPSSARLRPQIVDAPDSIVTQFVKEIMRNELLLRAADSAGTPVDSADVLQARDAFYKGVMGTMQALNLTPASLGDSATDVATKEKIAAERIDGYLNRLVKNEADFIDVPEPVVLVLRERFESRVSAAGVDRALAAAIKLRASADSARGAGQPPSAVPLPAPQP